MGASDKRTGLSSPTEPSSTVSALTGFDPSRWEWWSGPDDEMYRCGPFTSREEALETALSEYDDASHIYVIEGTKMQWPAPDAASVIDRMFENSDDLFYDDYPDPIGTKEQTAAAESELQAALDAWMDKWRHVIFPEPTMFGKTRNAEAIATETRRAETTQIGSVEDEGAGPKGIAQ